MNDVFDGCEEVRSKTQSHGDTEFHSKEQLIITISRLTATMQQGSIVTCEQTEYN
jgi:hypothetical protein